jgi:hypothetical protein
MGSRARYNEDDGLKVGNRAEKEIGESLGAITITGNNEYS